MNIWAKAIICTMLLCSGIPSTLRAADLTVQVNGEGLTSGEVGCALYGNASGFPLDQTYGTLIWLPANNGAVCKFTDVAEGSYAVAVSHDLNGNRKTDTNFLGIPKEAWGVSNNVRPNLRAPSFEEAAFSLGAENMTISVSVEK